MHRLLVIGEVCKAGSAIHIDTDFVAMLHHQAWQVVGAKLPNPLLITNGLLKRVRDLLDSLSGYRVRLLVDLELRPSWRIVASIIVEWLENETDDIELAPK